jgi:MFS family permease
LNGVGLSLAFPAIHSLVADSTEEHERGFAFGILQATGWVGGILGGFCAIFLAGIPEILGVPGWRMAFHLVGTFSVVVALLVYFFAVDPRFVDRKTPSGLVLTTLFYALDPNYAYMHYITFFLIEY